jgi:hypothetical protein
MSIHTLETAVKCFLKFSNNNTYLAFLWPSGKVNKKKSESYFSNIIYKKEIKLNSNGAINLLFELYKHMDWVGTSRDGFQGIKQKLIECFTTFDSFTILVFHQPSLKDVRIIKEKVRALNGIGYSSIHITDTKEEAIRVSELIFNVNGLHFLNWASPFKYISLYDDLCKFKNYLKDNYIESQDVVVDGSTVLSLYDLRKNNDIDYLSCSDNSIINETNEFEPHDSELMYHEVEKSSLVYDPKYFFIYEGIKFVSFRQTYQMKKNRGEPKDKIDCISMDKILGNPSTPWNSTRIKQLVFYWKIIVFRKIWTMFISILKCTRLYMLVRRLYRLLKSNKDNR